jgi:hypothetical protein
MCTVSFVGDYAGTNIPPKYPTIFPQPNIFPANPPYIQPVCWPPVDMVPRYEFEALKREVEALKELLKAAQKYDEATGQPHCEHEEKVAFLKKMAEYVGIDLSEVLK